MKWRKLWEPSHGSCPPKRSQRRGPGAGRAARFEALENRKLFAADVAEATDVDAVVYDLSSLETIPADQVEVRTFKFDDAALDFTKGEVVIDPVALEAVTFDATTEAVAVETVAYDGETLSDYPEIMMTFRGAEGSDVETLDDKALESEIDSPIMYMTGAVGDFEDAEVRTLELEQTDLTVTGELVDDAIADDDLIYYTMGPGPEVETTSIDELLVPEDINGDGNVTALDMLLMINALNSYGAMPSSQLTALPEVDSTAGNWDVNRDGYVTPLDALLLTNFFNGGTSIASSLVADQNSSRLANIVSEEPVADDSAEDALVAPMVARIRNPVDDVVADEEAPLVEDKIDNDILA